MGVGEGPVWFFQQLCCKPGIGNQLASWFPIQVYNMIVRNFAKTHYEKYYVYEGSLGGGKVY